MRAFVLLLLILLTCRITAQSCILQNFSIPDDRFVSIPIIISGATTDLTNDKICNITLEFNHESINQLRMSLVSPSGQKIDLLGPATAPSNPSFPPIEYDISLVQCSATAVPALGYSARWDNDQIWFGSLIQGSYFPYNGCLEGLNTGQINGTWVLEIEDVSQFDVGTLACISIEFCNSKNINTQFCDTRAGSFTIASDSYCTNEVYNFGAITRFPQGQSPSPQYINRYVITSGTRVEAYSDNTLDINQLSAGTYKVCQFSVLAIDTSKLPVVGSIINQGDFGSEFARLGLCGAVSNTCIDLIAKPVKDSVFITPPPICNGSSYQFRNMSFTTQDTFYVPVSAVDPNLCDTIYVIDLKVIDLNPTIVADNPNLACNLSTIQLTALKVGYTNMATYTWSTSDGNITSSNLDTANIDKIGTYNLVVNDQGCSDMTSLTITYDPTTPTLTVSTDTITCTEPLATIRVTTSSSFAITNIDWMGAGTPLPPDGLSIGIPGTYNGLVTHADGCVVPIEARISIDTATILPQLVANPMDFDCRNRSTSLSITNAAIFSTTSNYFHRNETSGVFETVSFPENVVSTGIYKVDAVMTRNGCPVSAIVNVRDTSYIPNVSLETFCRGNEVWVQAVADRPAGTLMWNGPGGAVFTPNGLQQRVLIDGAYSLSFTSASGCDAPNTNIQITQRNEFPVFDVADDSISCVMNTVQLKLTQQIATATYSWSGPFNFTSSEAVPTVSAVGQYFGEARFANGCASRDKANITLFISVADPSFAPDIIVDCSMDTIQLIPQDIINYRYVWIDSLSPPIISPLNQAIALVQEPGIYRVHAIDRTTNCIIKKEIQVGDERDLPVLDSVITKKTCTTNSTASIAVSIDTLSKMQGIQWTGPNGFTSNMLTIDDLQEGTYVYKLTTLKGCNLKDTFTIIHDVILPILDTVALKPFDTIDCDNNFSIVITARSDNTGDQFIWSGGSAVFSNNAQVRIGRPEFNFNNTNGVFTVRAVRPSNNCMSPPQTIRLAFDTLAPTINLIPNDIECLNPIPTISFSSSEPVRNVVWRRDTTILSSNRDTLSVTTPGTYAFTSTDNRGCIVRDSITVLDLRDTVQYTIASEVVGCEKGFIALTDTQNLKTIVWTGPESIADGVLSYEPTLPGTYSFEMTSILGCVYNDSIVVGRDSIPPVVLRKIPDTITCFSPGVAIGFSIDKPLLDISWVGPDSSSLQLDSTYSVSKPGTYYATIRSTNKCLVTDSITVAIDTMPPSFSLRSDSLTCFRSFAQIHVDSITNIIEYKWKGPGTYASVLKDLRVTVAGNYVLTAIERNGCVSSDSITIVDDKRIPVISVPDTVFIPCNGDSAIVTVTSDQPLKLYRWISPTAVLSTMDTLSTTVPGRIVVNVLSQENCQAQASFTILPDLRTTNASIDGFNILCDPDSTTLTANISTPKINYYWLTPDNQRLDTVPTFSSRLAGDYTLIVERSLNCFDTFMRTITIDQNQPAIINISQETPLLCKNTEVNLISEVNHFDLSRLEYTWSFSGGTFSGSTTDSIVAVTKPGTYSLIIKDLVNNCFDTSSITVVQETSTLVEFNAFPKAPTCVGDNDGQIELVNVIGGIGPYKISINRPGDVINDSLIAGLIARQYIVTLTDLYGCELSKSINVPSALFFEVFLPADTSLRLGDVVPINYTTNLPSSLVGAVNWYFNGEEICGNCTSIDFDGLVSGIVVAELIDTMGCQVYDTMQIFVAESIDWPLANIISTSAAATVNSVFFLPTNQGVEMVEQVAIFDRWGNMVWNKLDLVPGLPGDGWNPSLKGDALLPGVYAVYIRAKLKNGNIFETKRDITVIK